MAKNGVKHYSTYTNKWASWDFKSVVKRILELMVNFPRKNGSMKLYVVSHCIQNTYKYVSAPIGVLGNDVSFQSNLSIGVCWVIKALNFDVKLVIFNQTNLLSSTKIVIRMLGYTWRRLRSGVTSIMWCGHSMVVKKFFFTTQLW